MAILDAIVGEAAGRFGLGDKASLLVSDLLSLMTNEQSGGLTGFIEKFRQAGLGDLVSSWISIGDNRPISENQLEMTLGANVINNIASKVGISSSLASTALAFLVPKIIDFLTPNGTVSGGIPASITSFLSGGKIGGLSEAAVAAVSAASGGSSRLWRILLFLLLVAVAMIVYRYCSTTTPVAEKASTAVVAPAQVQAAQARLERAQALLRLLQTQQGFI